MENHSEISIGKTASVSTTVTSQNTARAVGSGSLDVFATPMMIALMERAACETLSGALGEGQTSVGTNIDVKHTAASPVGVRVTATATITAANGRAIEFEVAAQDETGEIGRGKHTRVIVDAERFMAKLSHPAGNNYLPEKPFLSVGIDGCSGGWVAVALRESGVEVNVYQDIAEICEKYSDTHSMIIDMPIGLPENINDVRPDGILRRNLKGKASSVFSTPCRQAVFTADYAAAVEANTNILNRSLSRQSYAIIPKIKEIDVFLRENPAWKNRLVESHPEYCFALLNGGRPVLESKKTSEGVKARLALLSKYYGKSYAVIEQLQKGAKTDDVLDALVLAVIGALGLRFGFVALPEAPAKDATGLLMQIIGAKAPKL